MFNTRDLGRWLPDGSLEHLGRSDDQVNARWFRVELDSVSAALESVPGCTRAVTLKYDNQFLVGFVESQHIDTQKTKAAVAKKLPYYYVPEKVIAMGSLPLTPRGKIDKGQLMSLAKSEFEYGQLDVDELQSIKPVKAQSRGLILKATHTRFCRSLRNHSVQK